MMPGLTSSSASAKKRKRNDDEAHKVFRKRRVVAEPSHDVQTTRIEELERKIASSTSQYENIKTLLSMLDVENPEASINTYVSLSLCRVFSRLAANGNLMSHSNTTEQAGAAALSLQSTLRSYREALLFFMKRGEEHVQNTALNLYARVFKSVANMDGDKGWKSEFVPSLLDAILETDDAEVLRGVFVEKYFNSFDDWRYYTLDYIVEYMSKSRDARIYDNVISLLSSLHSVPTATSEMRHFFLAHPSKAKDVRSLTAHKRRAQEAWLAVLRSDLSSIQRKHLLHLTTRVMSPWFVKPELLMDFLTDSYNVGGSTSLLALSGLFFLMQEKNLDYPQFYPKLYSLLDADLLHSKHRSRFFRLLDTFLSSTHLPAALVASFMKRLSRLCLSAPPAAIVAVIPWIYNLLKNHPTTTVMLHRAARAETEKPNHADYGTEDAFDMFQPDPILTNAIDSSLWEVETLQSHYHPNVASLARIISEQFTKQRYNVEDFLDHSYASMLEAELGRDSKKAPVVEWRIPRWVFTEIAEEEETGDEGLLRKVWAFEL